MAAACTACNKAPPEVTIKRCAKCSQAPYCSRDCQKADWKVHKKICGKMADLPKGSKAAPRMNTPHSPSKGLDEPILMPFTRLDNNTWLHGRPEKDVYRLLIDSYRLLVDDRYKFDGEVDEDSLYGGASSGLNGLRKFLIKTASRPGLLPAWWNADKQKECEALGMDSSQWQDLRCKIEKSDVIEHYDDSRFPMQLRMFAESVYGRGPGGANGTTMRKILASTEQEAMNAGR